MTNQAVKTTRTVYTASSTRDVTAKAAKIGADAKAAWAEFLTKQKLAKPEALKIAIDAVDAWLSSCQGEATAVYGMLNTTTISDVTPEDATALVARYWDAKDRASKAVNSLEKMRAAVGVLTAQ